MDKLTEINAYVEDFYASPGDHHVTFYTICVTYLPLSRRWRVHHRYKEFDSLRSELMRTFPDVPQLPPKSIWKRVDTAFLNKRKTQLDTFMREVVNRTDLARSAGVREFLLLDKFSPEVETHFAVQRFEYKTEVSFSKAALTDHSLVAISSNEGLNYLTHLTASDAGRPVASSQLYQRIGIDWDFKPVWRIPFSRQPTEMCWDVHLTLLAVGFDSGAISVYRIYTELNFAKYDQFCELPAHISAVRGLGLNYQNSYMYSTADDKRMLVTDLNTLTLVADITLEHRPVAMQYVFDTNRVYLTTKTQLMIYSVSTPEPQLTVSVPAQDHVEITCLIVNFRNARVYTGTKSGLILVFRLGMLDCEQTSHEEKALKWKGEVTSLSQSLSRTELYAGNSEGLVSIWSVETLQLLSVFRADSLSVNLVFWSESEEMLVTSGGERSFRIYELPQSWASSFRKSAELSSAETWKVTDDDLAGWDQ